MSERHSLPVDSTEIDSLRCSCTSCICQATYEAQWICSSAAQRSTHTKARLRISLTRGRPTALTPHADNLIRTDTKYPFSACLEAAYVLAFSVPSLHESFVTATYVSARHVPTSSLYAEQMLGSIKVHEVPLPRLKSFFEMSITRC